MTDPDSFDPHGFHHIGNPSAYRNETGQFLIKVEECVGGSWVVSLHGNDVGRELYGPASARSAFDFASRLWDTLHMIAGGAA